jgi:DNA repair and recombination protein RAD54B
VCSSLFSVLVVSNKRQTLDVIERFLQSVNYLFLRLDGSTPASKRMDLVNHFNSKYCKKFVFLLSAKAGGLGLNLIGANRLILYVSFGFRSGLLFRKFQV